MNKYRRLYRITSMVGVMLLMCVSVALYAQNSGRKINPKASKAYEDALLQLRDGLIKDAIPLLGKAIEYEPGFIDAYMSLAGVYGELKQYDKSVAYYNKARAIDPVYFQYYLLPYSINLAGLGRFEDALNAADSFLHIPNLNTTSIKSGEYRKQCYQFAINYKKQHAADDYIFTPENMGDSINTPLSEYYPSFTIDDSTLVFTRHIDGLREDFIQSKKTSNGYSKAYEITGQLNAEPQKGAINISQDGEWLLFAGNFPGVGLGSFDIYLSYNTPQGWSAPINLGPAVNTDFWETSPSLSPDKNTLYFTSNRPGGYGGSDIYYSQRLPNGKWTQARNMGPSINTKGDEQSPFIHADNNTLYFSSTGLPGYGGSDLFVVRKDSSGNWGTPQNLGYPINTIDNEGSLFVASDGVHAYYASDRADSKGGLDLYKFSLRNDVRPSKTLYVQGTVFDAVSKKNLPCAVELTDNATQKIISSVQTDETGFYFMTLPVGKDYTFSVNRKGYLFYSDVFSLASKASDSVYVKDIALQPISVNASLTLKNIQFALNSAELEPISVIELNKLLQLMTDNPSIHIEISGHTDNTGTEALNKQLSLDRAKAVAGYLMEHGIEPARLSWKGFGSSKPVASNDTEEGRALNRRTECTVTGL